ncbi:hypothetical protein BGZ49_000301, partial [Haplosporangium sp. Z 27]
STEEKPRRHNSSQQFNKYHTVGPSPQQSPSKFVSPPPELISLSKSNNTIEGHSPLSRARIPCYQPPYAFKDRARLKQHEVL